MKKQKLKTKKAAAKRFKITKTGKICFKRARHKHLLEHQSKNAKRQKIKEAQVKKCDFNLIKPMLVNLK